MQPNGKLLVRGVDLIDNRQILREADMVVLAAAMALSLAACGGSSSSESGTASSGTDGSSASGELLFGV